MTETTEQTAGTDPDRPDKKEGGVPEADAAGMLGISRGTMRTLLEHHAKPGDTWREGRRIFVRVEAVEGLRGAVAALVSPEEKNAAAAPLCAEPEGACELVVARVPMNRKIVLAKNEAGAEMRVRVHSNVNFLPGMRLRARRDPNYEDVYVLEGRSPRYRGRW